ncbi:MAG: 16S rRNA (adenine(1518)-N(6)/adenine(1519)-N(6))-dimethyltransferase RsmA [Alistipes sp.]|nr:16S rRNA (adenine(1518)-N(6)/adenine(1519)-N(6))-dimethyltransferase RsmA [Candidatus Minthomonas equi]
MYVRPKKNLGQHFLHEEGIAASIVESLGEGNLSESGKMDVLEVGPGTGVLTKYLLRRDDVALKLVELDSESVQYLWLNYPQVRNVLYEEDFLKMKLEKFFDRDFRIIGNFPYNISSQIFFKVLDYREQIPEVVGMVQKEVADRISSAPGNKAFGILSVLLQAWYDIEYLFTVEPWAFTPPPKVRSAVIRLRRNNRISLGCDETLFKNIVKTTFNQRRKTIRNSIKPLIGDKPLPDTPLWAKRPEQLGVEEFVELTGLLS